MERAATQWKNCDPGYWPALDDSRERVLCSTYGQRAREVTPTSTELDVFAPTRTFNDRHALRRPRRQDSDYLDCSSYGGHEDGPYLTRRYKALHIAAKEGHNDIVNILLDHGADIDSYSSDFGCACQPLGSLWKSLLPVWMLGPQAKTPYRHQTGSWPPLHLAMCSSHIETARLLVSRGSRISRHPDTVANKDFIDRSYSALHHAAASGNLDILEHIMNAHPDLDVNSIDQKRLTPLYYAIANRRWDTTAPWLLERGADINAAVCVSWFGETLYTTALAEACALGRFEDALKLLDLGADIDAGAALYTFVRDDENGEDDEDDEDNQGNEGEEIMEGPLPGLPPIRTYIPLLHLCCMDLNNGRSPSCSEIEEFQAASRPKVISRLLAAGISPDLDWKLDDGRTHTHTPLSVAVQHLNIPAIKTLLDAGANIHNCNSLGRSALMVAVGEIFLPGTGRCPGWDDWAFLPCSNRRTPLPDDHPKRLTVVRLLLDAGAPVNDGDWVGDTALHVLFASQCAVDPWIQSETLSKTLFMLLAKGADPCVRNMEGVTALQKVAKHQCVYALEILSKQRRIDLSDTFSLDEIVSIFKDARRDDGENFGPIGWRESTDDLDEISNRLVDILLEMDYSQRLSSNREFIRLCLDDSWERSPILEIADLLCLQGIQNTVFDSKLKMDVLRRAINARRWGTAQELLATLTGIDVNALDSNGHNLLLVAIENLADTDFVIQVVDAGVNVHQIMPIKEQGASIVTGLTLALCEKDMLERMLLRQPIRGNPDADVALYLHHIVGNAVGGASAWLGLLGADLWASWEMSLRTVLAAGADPCQVDDKGNTPLSKLLGGMASDDKDMICHSCHWLKPLSRGVDVNRKNRDGKSVADYLEALMADGESEGAKLIKKHLRLVAQENGDREIEWLR